MKFIFLGTGNFASLILKNLIKTDFVPIWVITEKAKPAGRGRELKRTKVEATAQKNHLKVSRKLNIKKIKKANPDFLLVVDYGKILPQELIKQKKTKAVGIHPSLLPKYRGPTPIQTAILKGDDETGVTLFELDKEIDHGPIIAQKKITINKKNYQTIENKLAKMGTKLFLESIAEYLSAKIKPKNQQENKASMTFKLKKRAGEIDFSKDAQEIERMVRAYQNWPGTFCNWDNKKKKIKILETEVTNEIPQPPFFAGTVFKTKDNNLAVACGHNSLLIKKLQLEGKKEMKAFDFLNGHPDIVGGTLR